ncbi:MAG TPA: hypothetical protein VGG72_11760 [Bryobacteraceae bacterium]|jgi:hypothetical protein
MRSPEEQEEFLTRGRFGEEKVSKAPFPVPVKIGLLIIFTAVALVAYPLLFESGRNSHGGIGYVSLLCISLSPESGASLGNWSVDSLPASAVCA